MNEELSPELFPVPTGVEVLLPLIRFSSRAVALGVLLDAELMGLSAFSRFEGVEGRDKAALVAIVEEEVEMDVDGRGGESFDRDDDDESDVDVDEDFGDLVGVLPDEAILVEMLCVGSVEVVAEAGSCRMLPE